MAKPDVQGANGQVVYEGRWGEGFTAAWSLTKRESLRVCLKGDDDQINKSHHGAKSHQLAAKLNAGRSAYIFAGKADESLRMGDHIALHNRSTPTQYPGDCDES